jgi:hypothetical protein
MAKVAGFPIAELGPRDTRSAFPAPGEPFVSLGDLPGEFLVRTESNNVTPLRRRCLNSQSFCRSCLGFDARCHRRLGHFGHVTVRGEIGGLVGLYIERENAFARVELRTSED